MKNIILTTMLLIFASYAFSEEEKEELPVHAIPVVQNWLHQNSEAVDVCVFREQWVAPTKEMPKGMLIKFGTITYVHKGSVKVGERVAWAHLFEHGPEDVDRIHHIRPDRVSMVDGELHLVIFNREELKLWNGFWDLGDASNNFPFDHYFHRAFLEEKKRDPILEGIPN